MPIDFVGTLVEGEPIQSLRDTFAGHAMLEIMSWDTSDDCAEIAKEAYLMADAMMKARVA